MSKTSQLIEEAILLYQEKPWDLFEDHEVFEIQKAFYGTAYCLFSIRKEKKCITIFEGVEGFTDLSTHFKPYGALAVDLFHEFESERMELIFDLPGLLEKEDEEEGEKLGYTPRELPVIRMHERRCHPDRLSEFEQERLILILKGLREGMSAYLKSGMNLDFTKRRFVYDVRKKTCSSKKTGYRPRKYDVVEIDDPQLMEELSKQERVPEIWEYDLQKTVLANPRPSDQRIQPIYMAALALPLEGQVVSAVPLKTDEDFQFQCIDLMVEAFMQRGLPEAVAVRHPLVASALMDLCKQLNIELISTQEFEVLDDFFDGIGDFMEGKHVPC